jgi:uncharacterized membrane protein YdjX (TVP38/TMEM64 family)
MSGDGRARGRRNGQVVGGTMGVVAQEPHRPGIRGALPGRMRWLRSRSFWALVGLGVVLGLVQVSPLGQFLSMEALARHQEALAGLVARHGALAVAGFVALYVVVVALSLPGATVMTVTGGMLFGAVAGAVLAAASATVGAALVFMLARRIVGPEGLAKLGPRAARIAAGVRRDAVPYLLSLRLVPLFPFVLVNLVPAFCGVGLRVFVLTTAVGILPATFVFALAGAGLGDVLAAGGSFEIGAVLTPQVLGAFGGMAALALATIPLRRRLAREGGR